MSNTTHVNKNGEAKNVNINTSSASMFNFLLGIILASFVAFGVVLYNSLDDQVKELRGQAQKTNELLLEYIKSK